MHKQTSFQWSMDAEPHKGRTKTIIQEHPGIRTLIGKNPYTFAIILFCVAFQIGISYLVKDGPWWLVFLLAYVAGAFACHTLFVCIHECAHNLVFKNRMANSIAAIIANLPLVFPSAISFQKYHLKHHSYQGVEAMDADMPYRWEARLINNSVLGKAIWLLFYPIFQMLRPVRLKEISLMDKWTVINMVVQVAFMAVFIYFFGAKALVYLITSFFFSVGLHPLGARWIQEHFLTHGDQETKSYYGVLNTVNLNVGYHNEHHDFPSIPWNKLPELKKMGGEHYTSLGSHRSYTVLLFQFLFDRNLGVYSRMARDNRGKNVKVK
ncbi:sphingolipid delta-4 desaturase [Chitinophaga costaii]|uniref:Sphingolipid delta-4 desaturase n=1 Tax=Chitinophaga costaii TaxID=1335309 RepID=A0A1C4CJS1_9BACT|nr:fatty acid desaturase [Chitinophaga costaii]PUZ27298.1 fatty acid desaturase [Chitinophaga costaii]SCC19253.1 sphingolipid delta-4 desaturase [Chitinophaga costaii]